MDGQDTANSNGKETKVIKQVREPGWSVRSIWTERAVRFAIVGGSQPLILDPKYMLCDAGKREWRFRQAGFRDRGVKGITAAGTGRRFSRVLKTWVEDLGAD
jgi:hypothetical protein